MDEKICRRLGEECYQKSAELLTANYLDVDFDALSQSLTLRMFHDRNSSTHGWTRAISNPWKDSRVEVGVLASEKSTEPESLSLGGLLTILGEDEKPSM